jgi:hypothetical protein
MKHKRKAAVAAGLLAFLIGNRAASQEIKLNLSAPETPVKSESFRLRADIDFSLKESLLPREISYYEKSCFNDSDFLPLYTTTIADIKNGVINSYSDLIKASSTLTENQKLVLGSVIANLLYGYSYDRDYNGIIKNEDIFFEDLQKALNKEETSFGLCRHISSSIETMLNKMGLNAAAVEGSSGDNGHVYNLVKLSEGTALVDSYEIFITKSKNIEKLLQEYQKEKKAVQFQHWFFENGKLKYSFITKDGERFLKTIMDYDTSLNPTKDYLLNKSPSPHIDFKVSKDDKAYSFLANSFGIYIRGGIFSEELSPDNETNTLQFGFKRKFTLPNIMSIAPDASILFGNGDNTLFGANYGLTLSTDNEKGINASLKYSGGIVNRPNATIFNKNAFSGGISYTLPLNFLKIEPYLLSQFSFIPDNLGESYYHQILKPTEFQAGLRLSLPIKKGMLVFEPNYTNRMWEDEFGGKLSVVLNNLNLNLEGEVSKSTYGFCPDKANLKAGVKVSYKNLDLEGNYKGELKDYDGEKDIYHSFSAGLKVKLR